MNSTDYERRSHQMDISTLKFGREHMDYLMYDS